MAPKKKRSAVDEDSSVKTQKTLKQNQTSTLKLFKPTVAKRLRAHCGAGRIIEVKKILQAHGYTSGCIKNEDENMKTLLDCAQNAARMGHLKPQCEIIEALIDLGLEPNFHVLYHASISCLPSTLRICLEATKQEENKSYFGTCAANALQKGVAANFVLLIEDYKGILPHDFVAVGAFISLASENSMFVDVDHIENDPIITAKVLALIKAQWVDAIKEKVITEINRLKAIKVEFSPDKVGDEYERAIALLNED